jgi:glycosyltransferase involved in cell wall biosynthesis
MTAPAATPGTPRAAFGGGPWRVSTGALRARPRILVIGINYWPEISGIAPYTTALAEHLVRVGHEVRVITGMPHYPSWDVFPGYRGQLWRTEQREGVVISRRAHYVPSRQSAARRGLYEASFLVSGLGAALQGGYDAVLGVVPSLSGAVLARVAAVRSRVPYALLFQDLMAPAARQSGMPGGGGAVAAATARVEGWAARGAARVAVVSPAFIAYLREAGVPADRIVVLPNWSRVRPPSADRTATRQRLGWRPDEQIALHTGNMGLKQGLEQVLEAARLALQKTPNLRFVLVGDGSQRESLERAARELPNVTFLPFQPEEDFPDLLAAADVLLLSERSSVADMSLPSKLTSYLMSGRPVVAAVASGGASAGVIRASRAGVVVEAGHHAGILSAIGDLLADPAEATELGRAGRAYADRELSAERSLAAIEQLVLELVEDKRRGRQWMET